MKLKINISSHYEDSHDYPTYMERGREIEMPEGTTIFKGALMYDKVNKSIGVVLGCIDEEFDGELRLDSDGMQSIENLRPARMLDFTIAGVGVKESIKKEILAQ